MKLTAFRIENYRCIHDSGWVDIGDIAVLVGKNESGKTALLKGLWKFNPFNETSYNLDRDWPRDRRKERSEDKIVATVRFTFSPEETAAFAALPDSVKGITDVEIKRNYKGSYLHTFLPLDTTREPDIKWVVSILQENLAEPPKPVSDHFKNQYAPALAALIAAARAHGGSKLALNRLMELQARLPSFAHPSAPYNANDLQAIPALNAAIETTIAEIKKTPCQQLVDAVHQRLPAFVYMDDYKIFSGAALLDEVKQRQDRDELTPEDKTIIQIMKMASLNLEDEVAKGKKEDKQQRILDLNDASQTLTKLIADRWSQKKYEVLFQADGQHFITFVKDADGKVLVPLEERSKGFQWFFSFDMMLMYETGGSFANSIILLDEPGLHLHATAQRDLLKRIADYARKNQLIYSTHLPFMIDFTRLDNIYVAEDVGAAGTKVHQNWATADEDARFTLQAALGLSWSQSLFVGQYNLVVENVSDLWYLTTLSAMLREAGSDGIDEQLVITPAGGANKVAYIGTLLHGQNLNVAVLLGSDPAGKSAYEQLVNHLILEAKRALRLGDIFGVPDQRTLEDLFAEPFYLGHVSAAYRIELSGQPLTISPDKSRPMVERIEQAFKAKGLEAFNKSRVAKRIMSDLAKRRLADLPSDTVDKFKKVIAAINQIMLDWKKRG
ncbi:MAG: hypothetical protein JWR19_2701 [Pedosphaera sp.]|nr:hypothetical protein [Pedosphaera sp.]